MGERIINGPNSIKTCAPVNTPCKCLCDAIMQNTLGILGVIILKYCRIKCYDRNKKKTLEKGEFNEGLFNR